MDCKWTLKELKNICSIEGISCSGTKEQICKRLIKHIKELSENKQIKGTEGLYAPEKYFKGLTKKEIKQRLDRIQKGTKSESQDRSAYKAFKTDIDPKTGKLRKTETSRYVRAFSLLFPKTTSLEARSGVTGIPLDILQRVYKKGVAAWRTGHRPGATKEQWGYARVDSFIMKGCTHYYPDHKEVAEAKLRSKKATEFWELITCMCLKGCKK
jgi:hypothetical protein